MQNLLRSIFERTERSGLRRGWLLYALGVLAASVIAYVIMSEVKLNEPLPNSIRLWQVVVSLGVMFATSLIFAYFPDDKNHLDRHLFLLIWASSLVVWGSTELGLSYFYHGPLPPNSIRVLASDARYYDYLANMVHMGLGKTVGYGSRPMLIAVLAALKLFVEYDSQKLILAQTVVLSVIPAMIYLVGKQYGDRYLGVFAAVLYIFREKNEIMSPWGTVTVKNIMTEPWMILGVLLVVSFSLRWATKKNGSEVLALAIGGCIGAFSLFRPNILFLLPVPFLLTLSSFRTEPKKAVKNFLLAVLGLVLVLAPITVRNTRYGYNASTFAGKINVVIKRFNLGDRYLFLFQSKTNEDVPDQTLMTDKSGKGEGISTTKMSLSEIASDKMILAITLLPQDILPGLPKEGQGFELGFAFVLNIVILGLGLAQLWRANRWLGLLPLLTFVFYFSTILIGYSPGNRHFIPIEWLVVFVYAAGVLSIVRLVLGKFDRLNVDAPEQIPSVFKPSSKLATLVITLLILLVGSFPVLMELGPASNGTLIYSKAAPNLSNRDVKILEQNGVTQQQVADFLSSSDQSRIYVARAFYPIYLYGSSLADSLPEKFYRLEYTIRSEAERSVVEIPLTKQPKKLQNGTRVLTLGCYQGSKLPVYSWGYIVLDENPTLVRRSPNAELKCPLPMVVCPNENANKCQNIDPH